MKEKLIKSYNVFFGWSFIFLGICIGITLGLAMAEKLSMTTTILLLVFTFGMIIATFIDWHNQMNIAFRKERDND